MSKNFRRGPEAAGRDAGMDAFFRKSRRKQIRRKERQLCEQVGRAVNDALCAELDDEVLNSLWVVKVEPAPTTARVLVWVAGPRGSSAELILNRLATAVGVLRAEVAATIHRKQVPMLSFALSDGQD